MKVKRSCAECSKEFHANEKSTQFLCSKACSVKWRAERHKGPKHPSTFREYECLQCGAKFTRRVSPAKQVHSYCSRSCTSKAFNIRRTAELAAQRPKELVEVSVLEYIKERKCYCNETDILKDLKIPYEVWKGCGFTSKALNERCGYYMHSAVAKARELIAVGEIRNSQELYEKTGLKNYRGFKAAVEAAGFSFETPFDIKMKTLRKDIIAWTAKLGVQPYVNLILYEFHIDHKTWKKLFDSVEELCLYAGVEYIKPNNSSYAEELAYKMLVEAFGETAVERQKTFDGLKYKGKLRYDFYIKHLNTLIEVDGEHHYEDSRGSLARMRIYDELKNKYALDNGHKLIRVPTKSAQTFKNRFARIIKNMDVVKPCELLERTPN